MSHTWGIILTTVVILMALAAAYELLELQQLQVTGSQLQNML